MLIAELTEYDFWWYFNSLLRYLFVDTGRSSNDQNMAWLTNMAQKWCAETVYHNGITKLLLSHNISRHN